MKVKRILTLLLVLLITLTSCSTTQVELPTEVPQQPPVDIMLSHVSHTGVVRIGSQGSIKTNEESTAKVIVHMYFDPICEACSIYNDKTKDLMTEMTKDDRVELVYHPVSYLNDKTVDDYSNRAAAYFLAVSEYAPDKALTFILSEEFRPKKPGADTTDDSVFLALMKSIGLDDEQIDKVDTNKENFVTPVLAGTSDFFDVNSHLLGLSNQTDKEGKKILYTPFILVNRTDKMPTKALEITSSKELEADLKSAIENIEKEIKEELIVPIPSPESGYIE